MENGKIVELGNHKELIEKKGIYYHLYTMSYAYTDDKSAPQRHTVIPDLL